MAIIVLDRIVALAASVRRTVIDRSTGSRATRIAVVASLTVLVATAIPVVLVLRTPERLAPVALDPPPGPGPAAAPEPGTPGAEARPATSLAPTPSHPAGTASPSAATPSSAAATTSTPAPAPLHADFSIDESALLSYRATVDISNPGTVPAADWTLVVTLPRESLKVTAVTGARVTRDGATWTFVPDGGGQVPGRGSVQVTFRVAGALVSAAPTACTIDDTACTGLPG
ncbi:cellulose binding domain-containing protein [Micromonospora sp. NPDC005367]|uniref:cellulose binding domain-containing protein n=1 Tax=Micromonospora sp. NPDC005367 TaxID=3155590 RepID=UPI0033A803AF